MIYFTADTHFCHGNIIGSCYRPFKDVYEMNKAMIQNWNSIVTDYDEVYILGDFLCKGTDIRNNGSISNINKKMSVPLLGEYL
jgi:calcineurin-like phosphoesterase family protein